MTLGCKNVLLISGLLANGSVQPDHLAVDHRVLRQGRHQVGKLSGVSQAGGEGHLACEEERTFSGRPARRGCHAGCVDDAASVSIGIRLVLPHLPQRQTDHIKGSSNVFTATAMPAQFTARPSFPNFSVARDTADCTSSSD
ncbi:hypothetical protein F7725_001080, partial [Dissostichus mawsoni]